MTKMSDGMGKSRRPLILVSRFAHEAESNSDESVTNKDLLAEIVSQRLEFDRLSAEFHAVHEEIADEVAFIHLALALKGVI